MNIYALSSGRGPSGIAILRMSGDNVVQLSKMITKKKSLTANTLNRCKFYDPKDGSVIDEGLLLLFIKPNSYTGEDLVEFHVHGSNAVINRFLQVFSELENCKLADPGEFTKKAFENNKIDLVEAESINDLIHAETELQRKQAVKLFQGNASSYYNELRIKLIKSLSYVEAKIDFAEDDLPDSVLQKVQESILEVHSSIKKILQDYKIGEKIRDGFRVSIIGEVNAGKSSLLNLISKRDVAIVSEEEGTTRDIIETYLNLDGYPVIIADTAGIRDTKNEIEKKGIFLAINKSKVADLNIIMIDNSLHTVDLKIKNLINDDSILVFNKSDINSKKNHNFKNVDQITVSVKNNVNIDLLINKIKDKLSNKYLSNEEILISRERHRIKLTACLNELDNFLKKDQNKDIEIAAEDLRLATRHLGAIVGKVDVEEILGSIFKDFCIGK